MLDHSSANTRREQDGPRRAFLRLVGLAAAGATGGQAIAGFCSGAWNYSEPARRSLASRPGEYDPFAAPYRELYRRGRGLAG